MSENITINQQVKEKQKIHYQPRVLKLEFTPDDLIAFLDDGRKLSVPTTWFSKIRKANWQQLKNYRVLPDGYHIHWPELDEDISLRVFTDGLGAGCC